MGYVVNSGTIYVTTASLHPRDSSGFVGEKQYRIVLRKRPKFEDATCPVLTDDGCIVGFDVHIVSPCSPS